MRAFISVILVLVFFVALALCAGETRIIGAPPGTERDRQGGTVVLGADPSQQTTAAAVEEEEASTLRFRRFFSRATSAFRRAAAPAIRTTSRRFERASGFSRHVYTRASSGASRAARATRRQARHTARTARRQARRAARSLKRVNRNMRKYQKIALKANKLARRGGRSGRLFKRLLKRADKRFKKTQKQFNRFTKAGYKKSPEQLDKEIEVFGSTTLPNGKCLSSCHWFTLPGQVWTNFDPVEKHQICGNCAKKYIEYDGPCLKFPAAFVDGTVSGARADAIKNQCKAQGTCSCASVTITDENVKKIKVKKGISKVFAAIGKVLKKIGKAIGKAVRKIGRFFRRF